MTLFIAQDIQTDFFPFFFPSPAASPRFTAGRRCGSAVPFPVGHFPAHSHLCVAQRAQRIPNTAQAHCSQITVPSWLQLLIILCLGWTLVYNCSSASFLCLNMVPVMVLDVNKLYFGAHSFYVPFALIKGKVLSKKAQNF